MIRLGVPADLPAASDVYRNASLSNAGDRDNLLAHPGYLMLGPHGLAEGRTHVAEEEGSLVGFATWAQAGRVFELEDLFVDPGWMRRGIATALVACIAEVCGRGVRAAGSDRQRSRAGVLHRRRFHRLRRDRHDLAPRGAWCWPSADGNGRAVARQAVLDMAGGPAADCKRAIANERHVVGNCYRSAGPRRLARFYSELLGWPIGHEEPGTAILAAPQGSIYVVFQQATDTGSGLAAGRRAAASDDALRLPGRRPRFRGRGGGRARSDAGSAQPQENVRVLLDPAGHPFCLCRDDG